MSIYAAAVARYFEAWNATDADTLAKAVAAAWSEDGTYTDPLADVRGYEQITAVIQAAHEQFPGFEFKLAGDVDGNHHIARFGWELVSTADGSARRRLGRGHPGRGRPDHLRPRLPRPTPGILTPPQAHALAQEAWASPARPRRLRVPRAPGRGSPTG